MVMGYRNLYYPQTPKESEDFQYVQRVKTQTKFAKYTVYQQRRHEYRTIVGRPTKFLKQIANTVTT